MWQSEKQIKSALETELKELKRAQLTQERANKWWATLDMNDTFLINLCSRMYGSTDQRIMQLYIIRENLALKTKNK